MASLSGAGVDAHFNDFRLEAGVRMTLRTASSLFTFLWGRAMIAARQFRAHAIAIALDGVDLIVDLKDVADLDDAVVGVIDSMA